MPKMSDAEVENFLRQPRIASLITLRSDGSPGAAPLWFEWTGAQALVFTPWGTAKVTRIGDDPRVALTIAACTGEQPAWVTIEGTAVLGPGGIEVARRLAPLYYAADAARTAVERWERDPEALALITITPTRLTHW